MTTPAMDKTFLYGHAKNWALKHQGASLGTACGYARWYTDNYPEGHKDHSKAFVVYLRLRTA